MDATVRSIAYNETDEVLSMCGTTDAGLGEEDVASRRLEHGWNELEAEEKESLVSKFFAQLKEPQATIETVIQETKLASHALLV